jgi:hypothetical protein
VNLKVSSAFSVFFPLILFPKISIIVDNKDTSLSHANEDFTEIMPHELSLSMLKSPARVKYI